MAGSVIVNGARTPIGRMLGAFKDFSAADLGGVAIKAALERSGVRPDQVQYVIMGQVLQAGAGQIPARQAAVKAGIPMSVPALTLNKVCLSGLDAIALADQLIRVGEFDIVVAGGQESMTNAPHLLPKSRSGYKYGAIEVLDSMALRRADRRVRPHSDGRGHRPVQREARHRPPGAGRVRRPVPPARGGGDQERLVRRRDHAGEHPAAQGRPPRGDRGRGSPGRTPQSKAWPGSGRPSARTARSQPGAHRRYPTVRPRSSS